MILHSADPCRALQRPAKDRDPLGHRTLCCRRLWHEIQSVRRLAPSLEPPFANGTMWSTSNLTPVAPHHRQRCPSRSSAALRVRCQLQPFPPRAALFCWSRGRLRAAVQRVHRDLGAKAPQSRQRRIHPARRWRRSRKGRMRRRMAAGSDASPKNTLLKRRLAPQRRHSPSAVEPSGSVRRQ